MKPCLNLPQLNSICPPNSCSDWSHGAPQPSGLLLTPLPPHKRLLLAWNSSGLWSYSQGHEINMPRLPVSIRRHKSKTRKTQRGCRCGSVDGKPPQHALGLGSIPGIVSDLVWCSLPVSLALPLGSHRQEFKVILNDSVKGQPGLRETLSERKEVKTSC